VTYEPLFVMPAAGIRWVGLIVAAVLLIDVAIVAALIATEDVPPWVLLLVCSELLVVLLVLWLVIPRRFELHEDALVLAFPLFHWRIPLETIEVARPAQGWMPYAYWGMRFATAPGQAVEIRRVRPSLTRSNLIVSPVDRSEFLRRLSEALERYRARGG
jgi:hypothetical protein